MRFYCSSFNSSSQILKLISYFPAGSKQIEILSSVYLFISCLYSPLSFSTYLSIQIQGYIFQTRFLYLSLFFVYPPKYVSISWLSTSISFYIFVNLNPHLSTTITFYLLFIQIYIYLFQSPSPNLSLFFYIGLYLFLSFCQYKFTIISFNFLLFISIYPSSIYLYHFLSLVYLFLNPGSFNSKKYFAMVQSVKIN